MLHTGEPKNFFPDFLVWKDGLVFAIDPKADNLIGHDAGIMLLNIRDESGMQKVLVRLITEGQWEDTKTKRANSSGYTVWSMNNIGKPRPRHCATIEDAVATALTP